MPKVFLSYSRQDEGVVKTLVQGLESARRDVWFDHDLGGGEIWWDAILENIRLTDVFLSAASELSLNSKPCQLELEYAKALGRPVLPVQVGPIRSIRTSPWSDLQIVRYDPRDAQSGFAVLAAVDDAATRVGPLPEPLPPPPPIPFEYLRDIGRKIESKDLSSDDQKAVIDQLRRALDEEIDQSVRQEILAMLRNLDSKEYRNQWSERQIRALLMIYGPKTADLPPEPPADPPRTRRSPDRPAMAIPKADSGGDVYDWVVGQLTKDVKQPPRPAQPASQPWQLAANPADRWKQAYQPAQPDPVRPPVVQPVVQQWAPINHGQPQAPAAPPPDYGHLGEVNPVASRPPNYWAMSIISFLCPLFGGIALYFSYQVGQLYLAGNQTGAERASRLAKIWGIAGIVIGSITIIALLSAQGG